MEVKYRGARLAEAVSNELNTFGTTTVYREFCERMATEHRTLQQAFTGLCLHWLHTLAQQSHYDGRNQASVEIAKKIDAAIDLEHSKRLPMV